MNKQISLFDREPPFVIWEHNPDSSMTCQTQGRIYCSNCNVELGYTGMYGWRLKLEDLDEASADEWVSTPNLGYSKYCPKCKVFVFGKGVVNKGVNPDCWFT